jgi:hypothetical protein
MDRTEIQIEGYKVTIVTRYFETAAQYYKATRVYVDGTTSAKQDELSAQEANLGDKRYSTRGEFPEVDALYRSLNREYGKNAVRAAATVVSALMLDDVLGAVTGLTFKFSRKAGCSCPCSPGVVASQTVRLDGAPVDIWVTKI